MISPDTARRIQARYEELKEQLYGRGDWARAQLAEEEIVSEETIRDYLSYSERLAEKSSAKRPVKVRDGGHQFGLNMRHGAIDAAIIEEDLDSIYLIPMEAHLGAAEFNRELFTEWVGWIKDQDNARVMFPGDLLECATKRSIGNTFTQMLDPEQQMEKAVELIEPIADKTYGIFEGNHEERVTRNTAIHPLKWVAKSLDVPFFSEGQAVLNVRVRGIPYRLLAVHGSSSAQTSGGRLNAARKTTRITEADCYIYGHTHGSGATKERRVSNDGTNVDFEKFYIVLAGSFLGYAGYAKRKAKQPLAEGCPRIRLDGERKDLHVEI